jgi:hypothetical protein
MSHPVLSGGCNCGAVRFEVTEPLVAAYYCHCKRCQRRSGTAAQPSALARPGSLRIVSSEEALRMWKPDDGRERWFCGQCGSHLFGSDPGRADPIGVRMGTFDDDPGVRPSMRLFVAYAERWEAIPDDGLPRRDEGVGAIRLSRERPAAD